ncbi:TssA family type VI secretion system protein [Reinekea marinisedimentorum]|uniref:Type VI secretion system protein VasJ n=1 Tax=Reinekea marinisedimentorum TaxID=230495 RepID=A0A4R3I6G8_9GAMM|nr:TssA family type VI secretion system protein [Reinekea marinisedimentorum]TCS41293.1 type VI secretion system protein VasJ [Reinekea marinisedimentorum]
MEIWIDQVRCFGEPVNASQPVGEDPRYSDSFTQLKAEIEKKSDVNFELIRDLCEQILTESSKDLRVASYFILALSRLEGFEGLAKGMAALYHMVDSFGDSLYPTKPRARQAALKWFQQDKVLTFAQSATGSVDHPQAVSAIELYERLFEQLSGLGAEPMSWPDLKKWLEKIKLENAPAAEAAEPDAPADNPPATNSRPAPVARTVAQAAPAVQVSSSIESTTQYQQALRGLLAYFREQKLYGKLVGTALSCQWGNLKMPPNEAGKTKLPAPREASLARIRNAVENSQWEEGLLASVDAFMEPSGQFYFDIAKWMHDCAVNTGNSEVASLVKLNVIQITVRLPKLTQLKFDSDEAFASTTAAAWLEQINEENAGSESSQKQSGYKEYLNNARTLLQEKSIQEAFTYLSEIPAKNQLETSYLEFCKAQLCIEQERSELALPILFQLEKTVDQLSLQSVVPDFAMQIWRGLYRLQKDRLATLAQDASRDETENHLAHLQSLMCTTDVASAMQWL